MENKNYTVINGKKVGVENQEQNSEVQITISLPENLMNLINEISSVYCEGFDISQEEFVKGLVLHGLVLVNSVILQEKQAVAELREQAKQNILSVFNTNEENKA